MSESSVNTKSEVESSRKKPHIQHWVAIALLLAVYDVITVAGAHFAALWLRLGSLQAVLEPANGATPYFATFIREIPFYTIFVVLVYYALRLYRSVWRFASFNELLRVIISMVVTGLVHPLLVLLLKQAGLVSGMMPTTYFIIGPFVQGFFTLIVRFMYRFVLLLRNKRKASKGEGGNAMIIGAGEAGRALLRDIDGDKDNNMNVACFIDDNSNKWGRFIDGVKVEGGRDDIMAVVEKLHISHIYLAIPSAPFKEQSAILNVCKETDAEVKILPHSMQVLRGEVKVSKMRDVNIEDLLGREVIKVNNVDIFNHISGKTILVTGGGGSIGSELCRQIAAHNPRQLIIFDVYENNAYAIQQELKKKFANLNLVTLIGSVRDSRRLEEVFEKYRPEFVFHAAAHKHVPLMEESPQEAVKNNCIGTYKTAFMAIKYGVERFILISTDKAVNPTNVMGASKRICEMVIQTMNEYIQKGRTAEIPKIFSHYEDNYDEKKQKNELPETSNTEFVAVRFGNVLGSNGSVIPLFKQQIAEGGPVTVTHPDIIRYFMTIPEAVSLVLQASVYAKGGEIFVLDMGEPVKIDTLARNLIKLSGFKPDVDIKIVYTGLRPGEKLYEEKLMAEEGL